MARTIAVGPAPPSRGSVIGEALGQGLGFEFARRQAEQRELEQQIEELNPIRLGITSESPLAQAAGVAADTLPGAQQFAAGADIPDLQGMQQQLAAQQTPQQRILQRLAADPERFARAFGGADTGELIQLIQSILSPEAAEPVTLGRTERLVDPRTGREVVGAAPDLQELTRTVVVSGDSEEGRRLGIPRGKRQRVKRVVAPNGAIIEESVLGGGQTINVGQRPSATETEGAKTLNERVNDFVERGDRAAQALPVLDRAADLLVGGVQTGLGQQAVRPLRNFANDFGVNLENVASKLGLDLGNLSDQEEFGRLTTQVIIDGFEQFKGNLNQREVELAESAFANLGRTEDANLQALATMRVLARRAAEKAERAVQTIGTDAQTQRRFLVGELRGAADLSGVQEEIQREIERMRQELQGRDTQGPAPAAGDAVRQRRARAPDPASASISELRQFVEGASPDELDALPESQRNAIGERLRRGE